MGLDNANLGRTATNRWLLALALAFIAVLVGVGAPILAQSGRTERRAERERAAEARSSANLGTIPPRKLVEGLNAISTRHYNVFSDVPDQDLARITKHMDALFDNYTQRFSGFKSDVDPNRRMSLFVFKTKAGYAQFFDKMGMSGANTGGMFFVTQDVQGLAVFLEGRAPQEVLNVLQHEGFHQFAHAFIGVELPIWVNEGIAQYFEDGILINDKFYLGLANAQRVQSVKAAIELKKAIDFNTLLATTDGEWMQNVITGSPKGSLQYDQSWSMVYFLVTADNGRYRPAFDKYLRLVAAKKDSLTAFKEAFGSEDTSGFKKAWQDWALAVQPDYLSQAVERMTFLGEAIGFMNKSKYPIPNSTEGLRNFLQKTKFSLTMMSHHGIKTEYLAGNEALYRYRGANGRDVFFQMLSPSDPKIGLPRISAPGLSPTPTLNWLRDPVTNELIYNISYSAK